MTDQMMSDKLIVLFDQLDREGRTAMTEIIALTSSHLYGIIHRTLRNEEQSAQVLQAIFLKLWDTRGDGYTSPNPLNALRAIAHRYAMTFKHIGTADLQNDTLAELRMKVKAQSYALSPQTLNKENFQILSQAYLDADFTTGSPKTNDKDRNKINDIVLNMMRGTS